MRESRRKNFSRLHSLTRSLSCIHEERFSLCSWILHSCPGSFLSFFWKGEKALYISTSHWHKRGVHCPIQNSGRHCMCVCINNNKPLSNSYIRIQFVSCLQSNGLDGVSWTSQPTRDRNIKSHIFKKFIAIELIRSKVHFEKKGSGGCTMRERER